MKFLIFILLLFTSCNRSDDAIDTTTYCDTCIVDSGMNPNHK